MSEDLHDHLQESKGPTIRCPICHYMARREEAADPRPFDPSRTVLLPGDTLVQGDFRLSGWRCRSAASHSFYLTEAAS